MIQIQNLDFYYKKQQPIYENLNVEFHPGAIYGILGKNGAGKSTLLRMMAGLLQHKNGILKVANQKPFEKTKTFLSQMIYVPEEVYVPSCTLQQFIKYYTVFYPHFSLADFKKNLTLMELENVKKLKDNSYGQQKKMFLSFVLACNTKYLLLDEPTNGLDIPSKANFRKLLAGAITEDKTIIISTHQVRDLDNLMDNIVVVNDKQIVLNKSVAELQSTLAFGKSRTAPTDNVVYSEPIIGGYEYIIKSVEGEGFLDTELLFKAIINNAAAFKN